MRISIEESGKAFLHVCPTWSEDADCVDKGITPEYIEEMQETIIIDAISHGCCFACNKAINAEMDAEDNKINK
jgi:hypothetical protein